MRISDFSKRERDRMSILNDLLVVSGSVFTLFLMMGVGFFLAKKQLLSRETQSQLSSLLLKVVAPCLTIGSLQIQRTAEVLRQMAAALGALVGTYVLCGAVIWFLFRRQREDTRAALRFGTMFGNVGFMGIPLISSILGDEAVIFCVMSLVVFSVSNWTYGVAVMGEKISPRKALVNPGVIGMVIAMALFLLEIRLPAPVLSAVNYIGDLNTPLAMVVIGGQMAGADLLLTFKDRRLYLSTALKLLVMPVAVLLVLLPFQLPSVILLTVVILAGCPTAGATSMFAQMYGKDTATAARMVTLATLLSILTLPVIALVARFAAG